MTYVWIGLALLVLAGLFAARAVRRNPHVCAARNDVPLLTAVARTEDVRRILHFISSRAGIGRPFVAPPRTPRARVAALRRAFVATMKDPALIDDMKKRRLYHQWSSGEDVQKLVADMLATPKSLIAKVRAVLGYK